MDKFQERRFKICYVSFYQSEDQIENSSLVPERATQLCLGLVKPLL